MTAPLTFYLTARYGRRSELCGYRRDLAARGHAVIARWLDTSDDLTALDQDGHLPFDVAEACAHQDREDLWEADIVVAFTEGPLVPGASRGGRHVELGIALGMRQGDENALPRIVRVGPLENIFCALADAAYLHWDALLDSIDSPAWLDEIGFPA